MLNRSTLIALLFIAAAAGQTLAQDTRPATTQEDTEIRDAVKGFLLGLARGNAVEAHRHATSDEVTSGMIDSVIPLIQASAKMEDASTKAFGADGGVFGQGMNPLNAMRQFAQRVGDGEIQVRGLYAVLLPAPAPQTQPADNGQVRRQRRVNYNNGLYLKRESNAWRVDLSEMPNIQQMVQMAPMMRFITEAMNTTADEVKAGDYDNPQDVQQALRQKIVQGVLRAQQGQ